MTIKIKIVFSLALLLIITQISYSQNVKLAQSGMKFLSVAGDARAAALADAVTSVEGNSESIFYNPASVARQESLFDLTFGNTSWIADINYLNTAVTFAPSKGIYGVFGLSLVSVDYGEFNRTIIGPDGGSMDVGTYSPTAIAAGLTYARALSDKFSVGGNVRYIYQDYGDGHVVGGDFENLKTQSIDIDVVAFDFGVLYKTGFKSLNLGMNIRNFSGEIQFVDESFQLPLTFKLGLSMNLLDLLESDNDSHRLLFAIDAEHPRDNKEMLHIGTEYTFMNIISLRAGYITPETTEAGINAGVGLKYGLAGINLAVDYSYTEFNIFNDVHRISVKLSY
jgi:hypothetical protein